MMGPSVAWRNITITLIDTSLTSRPNINECNRLIAIVKVRNGSRSKPTCRVLSEQIADHKTELQHCSPCKSDCEAPTADFAKADQEPVLGLRPQREEPIRAGGIVSHEPTHSAEPCGKQ